jgi:3-hydroxyisobutyrate dehydrogenase-like beta-hydroxyacid dehydrogenase
MKPVVAIIAQGQMGSAVGRRLTENGLNVVTVLDGRSKESAKRAEAAGMRPVSLETFCEADVILSIVPPGEAENLARRLAQPLAVQRKKPVYADCNAVNPRTVETIAAIVGSTDCPFVDAGIIGGPPKAGYAGPCFYLSGAEAGAVALLNEFGLPCKVLEGPVGAASALKMSYAGITKGLTALGSAMILAATRANTAEALHRELSASQPALLAWFERQVPSMFGKAYRWVGEMEEIAGFVEADDAARELFEGTARLYERLAADFAGAKNETNLLARFCAKGE